MSRYTIKVAYRASILKFRPVCLVAGGEDGVFGYLRAMALYGQPPPPPHKHTAHEFESKFEYSQGAWVPLIPAVP